MQMELWDVVDKAEKARNSPAGVRSKVEFPLDASNIDVYKGAHVVVFVVDPRKVCGLRGMCEERRTSTAAPLRLRRPLGVRCCLVDSVSCVRCGCEMVGAIVPHGRAAQEATLEYVVEQLETAPKKISVAVLVNFADQAQAGDTAFDVDDVQTRVKSAARCVCSALLGAGETAPWR